MKTLTRKHIDEVRCKICQGLYPDGSDLIADVYLQNPKTGEAKFMGYFCEFCRPPSAEIIKGSYTVIQLG